MEDRIVGSRYGVRASCGHLVAKGRRVHWDDGGGFCTSCAITRIADRLEARVRPAASVGFPGELTITNLRVGRL